MLGQYTSAEHHLGFYLMYWQAAVQCITLTGIYEPYTLKFHACKCKIMRILATSPMSNGVKRDWFQISEGMDEYTRVGYKVVATLL